MTLTLIMFKNVCEWTHNKKTIVIFDCCVSSVKKYRRGTSKCNDAFVLTLHQPIRLQHFEINNEKIARKSEAGFLGRGLVAEIVLSGSYSITRFRYLRSHERSG